MWPSVMHLRRGEPISRFAATPLQLIVQMEACEASGEGRFPDIGCWMWSNEGIRNRWIIENWMPIFIISKFRGTKS
ncbi:uncharacterized protein LOC131041628 isoform X2 [Cryptomeria japonica]|uniref:uncharacterized protein LOC131041628 isoform X2 n=1 Tax=Cryptomeria japonica TaxID=3369 RepID=UPI0027D9F55E|nr:uncharacterized protein LOC131041628 isoform X2 [Cryptomeria japonica]